MYLFSQQIRTSLILFQQIFLHRPLRRRLPHRAERQEHRAGREQHPTREDLRFPGYQPPVHIPHYQQAGLRLLPRQQDVHERLLPDKQPKDPALGDPAGA